MADDKPMRLFVGAAISTACAETLRAESEALAARADASGIKMRWVAPANYHVTVKFLGWVKPAAVFAIRDVVASALDGFERFEFEVAGLGAFPDTKKARVFWAGLADQEQLVAMAGAVDEALSPLGFELEKRAFHAHVTLARLKKVADVSGLVPESEQSYSTTRCHTINLYESVTKSSGSEYSVRWQWPLAGGKRQSGDVKGGSTN